MNILAQVIGFIALIFIVLSYQAVDKKKFLLIQIFANIFFGLQYLVLSAFSAFASSMISLFRTIIFFKFEKDNKKANIFVLGFFEILIFVFGMITFDGVISLVPICIAAAYTYGTWQKNLKITYLIGVVASFLWIFYNFYVGAYVSIIGSLFELFSSFIGLIRLNIKK